MVNKRWVKCVAIVVAGLLLLLLLPAGCTSTSEGVIKLGLNAPMSDWAAVWGQVHIRGLETAAEYINGHGGIKVGGTTYTWEIVGYDNKWDTAEARSVTERLVSEGAKFINILGKSTFVFAGEDILDDNDVIMMLHGYGGETITNPDKPLWFRAMLTNLERSMAFFPWLNENAGIETLVIMAPDSESGQDSVAEVTPGVAAAGMEVLSVEYYEGGISDFYSVLTPFLDTDPDMIVLTVASADEGAMIAKQSRELGYEGAIYLGISCDPASFVSMATVEAAENVYIAGLTVETLTPVAQEMKQIYIDKYGEAAWSPDIYDGGNVILALSAAIEEADSLDADKIAAALRTVHFQAHTGVGWYGGDTLFGIKSQVLIPDGLCVIRDGEAVQVSIVPPPQNY